MADETYHTKHPRSFWSFWGTAFWEGAKKSREGFGLAIEIFTGALGVGLLLLYFYSKCHKDFNLQGGEEFVNFWVAVSPLLVGLAWFLFHVFRQPYKIYIEQFEKHQQELADVRAEYKTKAEQLGEKFLEQQEKIRDLESELGAIKSSNKRRFLAFMAQLNGEIGNIHPTNWFKFFRDKIPNIQYELALIEDDFKPEDRDALRYYVNSLCELSVSSDPAGIPFVVSRIERICEFVKNPPNFP